MVHWLCSIANWEETEGLFTEMVDAGIRPTVITFDVLINALCKEGKSKEAGGLLELMVQRGEDLDAFGSM